MDKQSYEEKVCLLVQQPTYQKLKKDPTSKLERQVKELIKSSSIPQEDQRRLLPSASKPPRFYGLPKIHKEGVPLRPIVSQIGAPTYRLSKYLAQSLQQFVGQSPSCVKNSDHFIDILKRTVIGQDDLLVSFDVVSLFTNVPVRESVEIISELTGLPKGFPKLIEFCLRNSYFLYNGTYYGQVEGAAMGSPLSPVIANLFMEWFEKKALDTCAKKPTLWLRYVDDTFVIWPHGKEELQKFLQHLNSLHQAIQFTIEIENNNQLPFLDVLVKKKKDGTFGHSVYRKPTHTDRYLDNASHHHPIQKTSMLKTLFYRAYRISDDESLAKEKCYLTRALKQNGYRERALRRASKLVEANNDRRKNDGESVWATIPYVAGTTERVSRILKKHGVATRFNCGTKIGDVLPSAKDKLHQGLYEGIYQVPCSCGKSYIGETCRALDVRMKEHFRATKNGQHKLSAISEHAWTPGHDIKFDEAKVIVRENRYYPRLIREAIEITKTDNFNRDEGYHLAQTWKRILRANRSSVPKLGGKGAPYKEGQNCPLASST
jgi:hypothetical protein